MSKRSYELTEAISALIAQQPFFAVYMLDMLTIEESEAIPTACTDSVRILVNPKWFNKLNIKERVFVLCHEVLHGIMQHPERMRLYVDRGVGPDLKEFSTKKWNHAGDYVINQALVDARVGSMPIGGLIHPNFTKDDLVDDVYERLPDDPDEGRGPGWDTHVPANPATAPPKSQVQRALKAAAAAAKAQGKLPASLQRIVDDICDPQITWQDYLRKTIVTLNGKDQSTWARPNRRKLAVAPHVYWPGRAGALTGPMAVIADSSGSISDRELNVFFGEMHGILVDAPPEALYLLDVDAAVHDCREIHDVNDLLQAKAQGIKGGGGTNLPVGFDYLRDNNIDVTMAVILTDGYTDFGTEPPYETVWCITTPTIKAPYGTTIHVKIPHQ